MKKKFLFFLIFGFSLLYAQEKVSSKTVKFFIPTIRYSQYPCLDNVISQTAFFQMDPELKSEEEVLKKNYFDITGYLKDPSNGKLKIYITIPFPKYVLSQLDSVYDKKAKAWQYFPYSRYDVKINAEVKCAEKLIYSNEFVSSEISTFKGSYIKSEAKARMLDKKKKIETFAADERATIEELGIDNVIYDSMRKIQQLLNYKLGYSNELVKDKFEFMSSKGHPEYPQMQAFEKEITSQLGKVTLEKGLDENVLKPHLAYLESLLSKYPQTPENENIRFIAAYDLAMVYLLLENKEKALYFADILIKNNKRVSKGTAIIDRVSNANFVDKMRRTHTARFEDLKKLGFKIKEEKEEARLAFFERIVQEEADWE